MAPIGLIKGSCTALSGQSFQGVVVCVCDWIQCTLGPYCLSPYKWLNSQVLHIHNVRGLCSELCLNGCCCKRSFVVLCSGPRHYLFLPFRNTLNIHTPGIVCHIIASEHYSVYHWNTRVKECSTLPMFFLCGHRCKINLFRNQDLHPQNIFENHISAHLS